MHPTTCGRNEVHRSRDTLTMGDTREHCVPRTAPDQGHAQETRGPQDNDVPITLFSMHAPSEIGHTHEELDQLLQVLECELPGTWGITLFGGDLNTTLCDQMPSNKDACVGAALRREEDRRRTSTFHDMLLHSVRSLGLRLFNTYDDCWKNVQSDDYDNMGTDIAPTTTSGHDKENDNRSHDARSSTANDGRPTDDARRDDNSHNAQTTTRPRPTNAQTNTPPLRATPRRQ